MLPDSISPHECGVCTAGHAQIARTGILNMRIWLVYGGRLTCTGSGTLELCCHLSITV